MIVNSLKPIEGITHTSNKIQPGRMLKIIKNHWCPGKIKLRIKYPFILCIGCFTASIKKQALFESESRKYRFYDDFAAINPAIFNPNQIGPLIGCGFSTKSPLPSFPPPKADGAVCTKQALAVTLTASGAAAAFCFSAAGKERREN